MAWPTFKQLLVDLLRGFSVLTLLGAMGSIATLGVLLLDKYHEMSKQESVVLALEARATNAAAQLLDAENRTLGKELELKEQQLSDKERRLVVLGDELQARKHDLDETEKRLAKVQFDYDRIYLQLRDLRTQLSRSNGTRLSERTYSLLRGFEEVLGSQTRKR